VVNIEQNPEGLAASLLNDNCFSFFLLLPCRGAPKIPAFFYPQTQLAFPRRIATLKERPRSQLHIVGMKLRPFMPDIFHLFILFKLSLLNPLSRAHRESPVSFPRFRRNVRSSHFLNWIARLRPFVPVICWQERRGKQIRKFVRNCAAATAKK
jgi:hypothetical protein